MLSFGHAPLLRRPRKEERLDEFSPSHGIGPKNSIDKADRGVPWNGNQTDLPRENKVYPQFSGAGSFIISRMTSNLIIGPQMRGNNNCKVMILGGSAGEVNALALFDNAGELRQDQSSPPSMQEFDWGKCVADFGEQDIIRLSEWRGYSEEFCRWLHAEKLVGIYNGNWAFPVPDDGGTVRGCHYRLGDGVWAYFPGGTTKALILGSRDAREIWAFESQWDAFAVMDVLDWHKNDLSKKVRIVITRGCSNGKLVGGLSRSDTKVLTFAQNDPVDAKGNSPAKKWLEAVISHAGCPVFSVGIPSQFKDANDWTRAGATQQDVWTVIDAAEAQESATNEEEVGDTTSPVTGNPDNSLVLPSDAVSISACAEDLFSGIAPTNTLFCRNDVVMEAAIHDECVALHRITPQAFRSRVENYRDCFVWRSGGKLGNVLKPTTVTVDMSGALLESQGVRLLPAIRGLVNAPVLINDADGCRIVEQGYDKTGILVTGGQVVTDVPLAEAVQALQELVSEFDFVTEADRSRALAMLITPALKFGRHLTKAVPMNICEADHSQSGKTYLVQCMTAIYNEKPSIVTQKKGGVGSDDENFASALVAGRPFILFDNRRDDFDSTYLEAFITSPGLFPARIPRQGTIFVDASFFMLSLTSNGIQTTKDLANRTSIIRIRKKKGDHEFRKFKEGDLYDHIAAKQGYYLGAIFSVITAWLNAGKPKTNETRHSPAFREWVQTLDWIVQNVFHESPLMKDHDQAQSRFSNSSMAFVRQLAIAVRTGGSLGSPLSCSELYDLAIEHGVQVPSLREGDRSTGFKKIGMELGRLFKEDDENEIEIDGFRICRTTQPTKRPDGNGYFPTKIYTITSSAQSCEEN